MWVNSEYFAKKKTYPGYYECLLLDTLMVRQSIEFLAEKYEIHNESFIEIQTPPLDIIKKTTTSKEGSLCLRIYDNLDTNKNLKINIIEIIKKIESISLCLDISLICPTIRFISHNSGELLVANRKSIGRGVSFEITERGVASNKLRTDLSFILKNNDINLAVGIKHYLTGMTLLSLEDNVSGLIDAAFMQFYQGCEVLSKNKNGNLEETQKYISKQNLIDSRELQIITHQIWKVRHKYFGHGDAQHNIISNKNTINASKVASQVLIARYLCRRLIDINLPSNTMFCREMGLFSNVYLGNFYGEIDKLSKEFRVDYGQRAVTLYDSKGNKILNTKGKPDQYFID